MNLASFEIKLTKFVNLQGKTKKLNDSYDKERIFNIEIQVFLFNSPIKDFLWKALSPDGPKPFTSLSEVYPYGTAKFVSSDGSYMSKFNCHRLKHYYGGDNTTIVSRPQTFPKDN
ncbi:hypothetical protein Tco_1238263 [Tanacetum coccineum]